MKQTLAKLICAINITGIVIPASLLVAVVIMTQPALSQNMEHQRVWRSPYFLGRGHTGIALADEQHAPLYNPAGLAVGQGIYKKFVLASPSLEMSSATRDLVRQIEVEKSPSIDALRNAVGSPQHASLGNASVLAFRRAAVGFYSQTDTAILVSLAREAGGLQYVQADFRSDNTLTFSLAESFFSDLIYAGTTFKYINRTQGGFEAAVIDAQELGQIQTDDIAGTGAGFGVDLGFLHKTSGRLPLSFGLTIENLGGTAFITDDAFGAVDDLAQTINIGFAAEPSTQQLSTMRLLVDVRDVTGEISDHPLRSLHLGAEITIRNFFGVTAGLNQGYFTGGGYFDIRFLRLDIGAYTQERGRHLGLRPDTRFFFNLSVAL